MPEGDTLWKIASRLQTMIVGKRIVDASAAERRLNAATLPGTTVTGVRAIGKNLLIALDDGTSLHSHLGMTGSWHRYRRGEAWRKPAHRAGLVLGFEKFVIVCFSPEVLDRLETRRQALSRPLASLGPDILAPGFDAAAVALRMRERGRVPLGELILDQTVLCGVGNVYKSEGLFLCRLDPFGFPGDRPPEALIAWIELNRKLMLRNLDGRPRRTRWETHGPWMWVYGRSGQPCLECGKTVRMRRQGDLGRSTYWCPGCQPASSAGASAVAPGRGG